jgi:hypothetical protein
LAAKVNYWPEGHSTARAACLPPFEHGDWFVRNVTGLAIYRYLAFITRGFNPEDNPWLMGPEEFDERARDFENKIETAIDALLNEGGALTPPSVAERVGGNRGLTRINAALARRGRLKTRAASNIKKSRLRGPRLEFGQCGRPASRDIAASASK